MVKRSINIWKGIDKTSIVLFLLLIIIGWINIYAAVFNEEHSGLFDMTQRYGKQFIWIVASLVIAVFIVIIDNRFYFFFSWFIYGICMVLLILVVIVGKEINGAKSWFEFGSISLQPSEMAKFGTSLALASYLNNKRQELKRLSGISSGIGDNSISCIPDTSSARSGFFNSIFFIIYGTFQGRNEPLYIFFSYTGNSIIFSYPSYE